VAKGILAPGARKLIANKQTNKQTLECSNPHTIITLIPDPKKPDPRSGAHQSFASSLAASAAAAFFGNSIHLCNFHLNYSHQKYHG